VTCGILLLFAGGLLWGMFITLGVLATVFVVLGKDEFN
jgi:hypothetical protein